MNSRYFLTTDSLCNSATAVPITSAGVEDRTALNPQSRASRNSSPFLIRLAVRVSRSRWYNFLRRVFHYQNGSGGSDLGPNPFDSGKYMIMEFMALLVQITLTVYTLVISKEERPIWPMRIWVSGYAFGCFLSLVLLIWRYRFVYLAREDAASDLEQQIIHDESRNLQYIQRCKTSLELLFAIWFVMGNVWVFDARFGSYRRAPKLHVLCISLLSWNAVSYSFPFILFVLLCCCVPLLSSILGYNMNNASISRGATEEQLSNLPSWKYKDVCCGLEHKSSAKNHEIPECCICLAKYRDKEEIRQLPCTHIFHLKCVDQWLKMISCCPLSRSRQEEMESSMNKPGKFSGSRPRIAEQPISGSNVASEAHGSASKTPLPPVQCLCSPTKHAGSFRCRQHRISGSG